MTQAVLWDNDGVLLDTEALFFEVTRSAFAKLQLQLTRENWGIQYLAAGRSSREIAASLGAKPEQAASVMDERNEEYRRALQRPLPARPQVRETLAALAGRVRLAMVTGCPRRELQLMHATTALLPFFEQVITGNDCPCSKPHPEPYLIALKALGVKAGHCLAIEDSPRGLASATAAGVPCVVVPTELTRGLDFPGALSVEHDVSAVLKHIVLKM